jgi:hypothetical protein
MNNNNKSSYSKTKLIAIYRYLITFLNGEIIILLMRDGTQTWKWEMEMKRNKNNMKSPGESCLEQGGLEGNGYRKIAVYSRLSYSAWH